jgi:thiol-disulfide isomerase/thioredoxin
MDKIIKLGISILVVVIIACLAVFFSGISGHSGTAAAGTDTIYFFYGEECPHCHNVLPLVINLTRKYPDANIQLLEIWHNETNNQTYTEVNAFAGLTPPGVPEVILGKTVLLGDRDIPVKLEGLIQDDLKKKH